MSLNLFNFNWLIVIDSKLKFTFFNVVLYFTRYYCIFSCLQLLPHVHFSPQLKLYTFRFDLFDVELIQSFLLIFEIETHYHRRVAKLFVGIFFSTIKTSIFLYNIHQNICIVLLYSQNILMIIFYELLTLLWSRFLNATDSRRILAIPFLLYLLALIFVRQIIAREEVRVNFIKILKFH